MSYYMHSRSLSYLILPIKLIFSSLHFFLSLSSLGDSTAFFLSNTQKHQEVTSNVKIALHLVSEVKSPHRGNLAC